LRKTTIIIGGGAMGSAIACFLSAKVGRDEDIVVIERDPTYAMASSSLSCSSIRQQFSTPLNIELSRFGWDYLLSCAEEGGAPGAAVGLQPRGYLFLGRPEQEAALRQRTALARGLGAAVREFDGSRLAEAFPWMQTGGLSYGAFGTGGEGWFDGYLLLQWYRSRAREGGVRYLKGEVLGFRERGSRLTAVELAGGVVIDGEVFVNAAGPWSAGLARMAGVDIPVRPRRRTPFLLSCPTALPDFPILVDASGVYIRPEGPHFVAIVSPGAGADPDEPPLDPDFSLFEDLIWPTLAERVPAFEALRVERAWAGYYEYNTADQNGLVGQIGPDNFLVATGFSGHGLMHSAGVGRGMAELLGDGGFRTLDLSPLSPARLITGALIVEDAIY
jgi:glycine/D-amino acid oxidase-like deaminating enzyme